ncbi:MAG TPA: gluconate:H+ symporter [Flexivirga sp.]|uniref:GntP family permease n=1 Tax=Flexivirga sp. TaxID=1962927 RepID=UPI002BCE6A15|nr:gluconate:H+ symporter [Flexivirga sp.]HWC21930.1 gluconate:H+ symporter [Flexivirga sp.]
MSLHSWYLLALLVVAIALLIALINSRVKLHPFVALLVVSVLVGVAAGEGPDKIASSLEDGAGGILGDVGMTLALGTMLGRLMADSGATDRIARSIVSRSSVRMLPFAMAAAAFVIGIPMFFEVGLIVLLPLVFSVAQQIKEQRPEVSSPYTLLMIPTVAALATLHGMVPPHPGPLVAVDGLHADLGKTILIGFICAVPTVLISGPLFARFMAHRVVIEPDAALVEQFTRAETTGKLSGAGVPAGSVGGSGRDRKVRTAPAIVAILVPVALMLFRTFAEIWLPEGSGVLKAATLVGTPVVAMLIGFLYALVALGFLAGRDGEDLRRSVSQSLQAVVGILLIIGGGGAFNGVLKSSGIGDAIASATSTMNVSVVVLGWLLALLLSVSTGSATVGIVSATGIVAPLLTHSGSWEASLVVVAIGAGSVGLNYVNHAGFWLVKESFGMSMGDATKTHTAVQTLVSVVAFCCVLVLSIFV